MSTDSANDTIGYLNARIDAMQRQIDTLSFQKDAYKGYLQEFLEGSQPKGYRDIIIKDLMSKNLL